MTVRNVSTSHQYLDSFINFELTPERADASNFKLERVRSLLAEFGDPQNFLKVIHIAGSKGKGSTAVMTATVLRQAGFKVGLYTSPHLNDYCERIRILDEKQERDHHEGLFPDQITEDQLSALLEDLKPKIEKIRRQDGQPRLTFFEVYTALALYYFAKERVDFVVLETGLGGRLDATNVCESIVCAITPVSLEHTEILGASLSAIAKEKGAIIKSVGQRVVLSVQSPESLQVLKERCDKFSIRPVLIGEDIRVNPKGWDGHHQICDIASHQFGDMVDVKLSLPGGHQCENAATAIGIIGALMEYGYPIDEPALREGFRRAKWPGRFELFTGTPSVILDGAHNGASAIELGRTLREIFPRRKVHLVLGLSKDKNREEICRELDKVCQTVVFTQARHPRALKISVEELKKFFPNKPAECIEENELAFAQAVKKSSPDDVVLVTGSLFLISELRKLCTS